MRQLREMPVIASVSRSSRHLAAIAILSLGGLSAACAERSSVHLVEVSDVEVDEDRATLIVLGDGFVVGSPCELGLDGTLFEPGRAARPLTLTSPCRAVTGERATVDLENGPLAQFGPALFEGRLDLSFYEDEARGRACGQLGSVTVRLGARRRRDVAEELPLRHAAARFQQRIGIVALEITGRGLALAGLDPQGAAAQAGLAEGDLVRRVNGRPVLEPFDLLLPPGARTAELEVSRKNTPGMLLRSIALEPSSGASALHVGFALLVALACGLLLPALRSDRRAARAPRFSSAALACLAFIAPLAISLLATGALDARSAWGVAAVLRCASLWLEHARGERAHGALMRELSALAAATLCIAALGLAAGTAHQSFAPESSPLGLPWNFPVFASPAGLLAGLGLSLSCSPREPRTRHGAFTGMLLMASAAWLVAGLGLGGSALPPELEFEGGLAADVAGFVVLGLKLLLSRSLLTMRGPRSDAVVSAIAVSLFALLAALALPVFAPRFATLEVLGATSAGLVLGRVLGTAARRLAAHDREHLDGSLATYL